MPRNYKKITDYQAEIQQLKLENEKLRFLLRTIVGLAQTEQAVENDHE